MSASIQLPVIALKPALAGLGRIISKRSTLPVLGCVKITRHTNAQLSFEGTDLDAMATYMTEIDRVGKEATVLIPFEDLCNAARGCPKSAFIDLAIGNKEALLRYPAGGTWLEKPVRTVPAEEWPSLPRITSPASGLGPDFTKNLVAALDCASDEKPDLVGGWLDARDPRAHYVVASDGRQLFAANSFRFDFKDTVLVPKHRFLQWPGFLEDGEWSIRIGERSKEGVAWTQLESAYWTLLLRRPEAKCPNWKQVIPTAINTHATFSREAVAVMLDVLPKLPGASQANAGVTIDLGVAGALVTGGENGHSSSVTVAGVEVSGIANRFAVDRSFVIKALKLGLRDLAVVDGVTPVVFSDHTRKLVIAPLRPDPAAPSPASAPVEPPVEITSTETTTNHPEKEGEPMKTINRINPSETTTGGGAGETEAQQEGLSPLRQAAQKVDQIKDTLRGVLSDLNDVLKALNQAQREQRGTEKEVEEVRDALQQLQRIRI